MVRPIGIECREARMTPDPLFAAVYAAEFPAQAILRLRPDLQSQPVVVLDGSPPQERVCSLNLHARKRGVVPGLTRLEVEDLGGIQILSRSTPTELAARTVLLECVSQFSPRIEECFPSNACSFILDISGSERLFGPPDKLAHNLRAALLATGFRASIAISSNFDTARIKSEFSRGISVIPNGAEAAELVQLPISALHLELDHYETFALWGIRALGDLAELPKEELISRLGQQSLTWLSLARGVANHTFQPMEEKFQLQEHIEFETHIEQLDSLLFIGANMINNLVSRASTRALSLANLSIEMKLEESRAYHRVIRPAIPSNDRKFLLKLLQLEIAAYPPQAAVVSLTLTAEAGQHSKVQLGLFAPPAPEPSRLDVTLARLKAMVGSDRAGSPVLHDSHRPGSFEIQDFSLNAPISTHPQSSPRASLRRMRPPHTLRVQINTQRPATFRDGNDRYEVQVAYGPWQSSGCWWSVDKWDLEEWDVMAINNIGQSIGCLLVHDRLNDNWLLDAFYD
jgi:protein ImuB